MSVVCGAQAQNIQLHHDFGRSLYSAEEGSRPKTTVTLEQFKADGLGSWFYFVDVDLGSRFTEDAYTEISREFNLGKQSPLAAHVEYNGGLSRSGSYQQSALAGLAYNGHSKNFAQTWSVQLMYKRYFKSYENTHAYHSAQLTGVWSTTFAHRACTFAGFVDFWRGEKANGHGQLVAIAEPQFWFNLNSRPGLENFPLSIGTEVEISSNFVFNPANDKTFFVNPTLALKWAF